MDLFFTEQQQIIFLKKHGWVISQATYYQHRQIHGSQFHEYSEIYDVATKSDVSLKIEDAFKKQLEICLLNL
jgi:hypothetical protein